MPTLFVRRVTYTHLEEGCRSSLSGLSLSCQAGIGVVCLFWTCEEAES